MKKLLLLLLFVVGCCDKSSPIHTAQDYISAPSTTTINGKASINDWKDNRGNIHEYLFYWGGGGPYHGGGSMTHYPDCKYCKEKGKKVK